MKRLILKQIPCFLIAVILLLNLFGFTASASGRAYSWYIKKNGNKQPYETELTKIIDRYSSFYVDKSCGDDATTKKLYLTFDAGYENGNIALILDILNDKGVKSAFFILNNLILKNTDLVVRMANEGHLVCNHTNNHKDISDYDLQQIERDLGALATLYKQKTGLEMAKYFRFPEGRFSEKALKSVEELGYVSVFWSMAYADWDNSKQLSEAAAIQKLMSHTHNGAIILLHPTSSTNVKILPLLIDKWRSQGYEFGTLDELHK